MPVLKLYKLNVTSITISDDMGQLRNGLKTAFALHRGHKIIIHTPHMKMPFKLDKNAESTSMYAVCLNVPLDDVFGGDIQQCFQIVGS